MLFPSLRQGYLVAPTGLLQGLIATRRMIDTHLPLLEQMALTDFITEGHFARHLRKMRVLYKERCGALIEALTQELSDILEVVVPETGMHLVTWLLEGMAPRESPSWLQRMVYAFSPLHHPKCSFSNARGCCSASQELHAGVKTLALTLRKKRADLRS